MAVNLSPLAGGLIYTYEAGTTTPWYAPLDLRLWDVHSWFWNLVLPIVIAGLIVEFVQ